MFDSVDYIPLIIPTILIPLTFISVGISVVATFIAGMFGVKLKAEGPKQLLEILLKPRVIVMAVVFNLLGLAGYRAYNYIQHHSAFSWTIARKHVATMSSKANYQNFKQIPNVSKENKLIKNSIVKAEVIWEKNIGTGSIRSAALSGESLFFGSRDGYVYEANLEDGEILRKFFIGTTVSPTPIVYNNHLFVGEGTHSTHHARIYKINLSSGEHISSYQTKGHTESSPTISSFNKKELMFFSAGSDGIYAVDPKTMELVWTQKPGHVDASAAYENGQVFTATGREKNDLKGSKPYAISYDFLTGKELWKNELPLSAWMKPALTKKYVCYPLGEIYFKSEQGALSCFSKVTGEAEFSINNNAPLMGVPFALGENIIFTDLKGKVCMVDINQRSKKWCYETKAEGRQIISISYSEQQSLLALSTYKSGVYFIDPMNGAMIFHYKPKGEWGKVYASPRAVPGGWVIVNMSGRAQKIKLLFADNKMAKK